MRKTFGIYNIPQKGPKNLQSRQKPTQKQEQPNQKNTNKWNGNKAPEAKETNPQRILTTQKTPKELANTQETTSAPKEDLYTLI